MNTFLSVTPFAERVVVNVTCTSLNETAATVSWSVTPDYAGDTSVIQVRYALERWFDLISVCARKLFPQYKNYELTLLHKNYKKMLFLLVKEQEVLPSYYYVIRSTIKTTSLMIKF